MGQPLGPAGETGAGSTGPVALADRAAARLEARVNRPFGPAEEEAVQRSLRQGQSFGADTWRAEVAARLGLESTFRPRGRSSKRPENGS